MTTRACAGSRNAHGACCSSVSRNFGLTTTCGSEIIRTILRTLWEQSALDARNRDTCIERRVAAVAARVTVHRVGEKGKRPRRTSATFRSQKATRLAADSWSTTSNGNRRSSPPQDQTMIRGFAVRVCRGQTWNRLAGRV